MKWRFRTQNETLEVCCDYVSNRHIQKRLIIFLGDVNELRKGVRSFRAVLNRDHCMGVGVICMFLIYVEPSSQCPSHVACT